MRRRNFVSKYSRFFRPAAMTAAFLAVLFFCALLLNTVPFQARMNTASVIGCWLGDCSVDVEEYTPECGIDVSPSSINPGDSATLSWTSNIISPYVTPDLNKVDEGGSVEITPSKTTTYTLYDNAGAYGFLRYWLYTLLGISTPTPYCSTTIQVSQSPAPPTCLFSSFPPNIVVGGSSALYYSIQGGVSSAHIQNIGDVQINPPLIYWVSPTATTTYKLNISGPGGNNKCYTDVNVVPAPKSPTISLDIYPPRTQKDRPIILSWNSWNVESCILFDSDANTLSTDRRNSVPAPTLTIDHRTSYTLTCADMFGNILQKTVTVNMVPSMMEI